MANLDLSKRMDLVNNFDNHKKLIEIGNNSIEELDEYFKIIKNLLYEPCNDENFNEAFQNFIKVFDKIPLMITPLRVDIPIVRARANCVGEIFKTKTELSYHSNPEFVSPGRFNQPKRALFYGALPITDSRLNFGLQSCLESCKGIADKDSPLENQDFTLGLWSLNQEMPVVNFCFDSVHLQNNPSLRKATEYYLRMVKDNYSTKAYDFIRGFNEYFSILSSSEMSNNECYYILTALFAAIEHYFTKIMKKPFPGLIYPSSATEGIGLNIVLVKPAVDYCLKLEKVVMYKFKLDQITKTYFAEPCSNVAKVIDDGFELLLR